MKNDTASAHKILYYIDAKSAFFVPFTMPRTDGEIQRTREFAELVGINYDTHKVGGVIWYGFAAGGLGAADSKKRRKGVDDVLEVRP